MGDLEYYKRKEGRKKERLYFWLDFWEEIRKEARTQNANEARTFNKRGMGQTKER
jgi:hypothetical protein